MNFLNLAIQSLYLRAFFSMFCVIYFIGYFVVFRAWNQKYRPEAASCFTSLFHGTPAVLLATHALIKQLPYSDTGLGFAALNTETQNMVLDFSIAYFVVDLLHYLILIPSEYLFIAHHLATLFVFITCRYVAFHGAYALLVLLILAEVTSFCQNIWTLAGMRRIDSPRAEKLYRSLALPFYTLYTLMRVVAGPLFFFKMSAYCLSGKANAVIPQWISVSWIIVVGGAISVSILWISNLWIDWYKERARIDEKKRR